MIEVDGATVTLESGAAASVCAALAFCTRKVWVMLHARVGDLSQTLFMLTECAAETLEDSQESQRCRSLLPTSSTPLPPPWAAASQTDGDSATWVELHRQ